MNETEQHIDKMTRKWNKAKRRKDAAEKWGVSKWRQLCHLRIEQVSAICGEFYTTSSQYANETLSDAITFVPLDNTLPVLTRKQDGSWGPRGF